MSNINERAAYLGIRFSCRKDNIAIGKGMLYVTITYNKESRKKSLGYRIDPKQLDKKKSRVKEDEAATQYLQTVETKIKEAFLRRKNQSKPIKLGEILSEALTNKTYLETLPTVGFAILEYRKLIEQRYSLNQFSRKTYKRYLTSFERLETFVKEVFSELEIPLSNITFPLIERFVLWQKEKYKVTSESIRKSIQLGRAIYKMAYQNGWHAFNPFEGIKTPSNPSKITFKLTKQELRAFENLKLENKAFQIVLDTFLFCCYTGLAYCDIRSLKKDEIKGNTMYKRRGKTNTMQTVYLYPQALALLSKYDYYSPTLCFPTYSNSQHNRVLKELAIIANIGKEVTTHFARKTFAQLMIDNGLTPKGLQGALGHTKVATTEGFYANLSGIRTVNEMKTIQSNLLQK